MARKQAAPAPEPRVWGYTRVSTAEQSAEGVSLDEQRRRISGRALELGVELTKVFVEEGVSGSTPLYRRPQGERLLAAVRPGDTVIAAKLDRVFRSALDALQVIEDFRRRSIRLILLDVGDVSGNGVSRLVITIMSAVAEFERKRISERVKDSKAQLRHENRHQGGSRPFGWRLGEMNGHGKARELIPIPREQEAIAEILKRRKRGQTLMAIRDAMRVRGFAISHQLVADIARRHAEAAR
jgi:DNA invertase Pin-like site-specific DNA recombinase